MIDLPTALYTISIVSLCYPQDVPAKTLRILFLRGCYWLNDSEVSRWTPKIFGHWISGSCECSISIFIWVMAWCVSGVNNVTHDFGAEINTVRSSA